jgi:hypothetical protein
LGYRNIAQGHKLEIIKKGNEMSRNAYRVKRIITAKSPSFNLSYDEELLSILEEFTDFYNTLNSYGNGIIEITDREFEEVKDKIEELIDGLKSTKINQPENKNKAKCYRKVLTEMEREIAKEGHISYEIY